ncbi:calcineurin-like phosphoesterase family protein [Bacillus oleivorans]|uniref:Calcineurin-like phosphoesterase family protein n=1 Tax=Bacillus oleivorans TaxID=1448271 RepID=A0A285CL65_9BACI|nr:metallophosphoesterase [Bacillus oleivorans]SNX67798.1 calcineurin-like phosphoesterase family protein [Bacillus oleivorans]
MANQFTSEWTQDIVQRMMELAKEHPLPKVTEMLNEEFNTDFSYHAVRTKYTRSKKNKINYHNRKNTEDNAEKYINLVIQSQKELEKFDDYQTTIDISLDEDKPIGIVGTGDWHTGGLRTNHEQLIKDSEIINGTDGLYSILMGDYADNYLQSGHKGAIYGQISNPDKQKEMVEHIFLKYYKENALALIKGNHDAFTEKSTGEDYLKVIARKMETPYLWFGGNININLGGIEYKIHARHNYRYNSSINTTNSQRNLFNSTNADIIMLAHLHFNEIHSKSAAGKDTHWVRTGSYKITDEYGEYLGFGKADTRMPLLILFPKTKKIVPYRDMYDGIDYLKWLRERVTV